MRVFMSIKTACAFAHVSRWTMYRWITSGQVQTIGDGHDKSSPIYVDAASLQAFMTVTK